MTASTCLCRQKTQAPTSAACLNSSPGRMSRTDVWISQEEIVFFSKYVSSRKNSIRRWCVPRSRIHTSLNENVLEEIVHKWVEDCPDVVAHGCATQMARLFATDTAVEAGLGAMAMLGVASVVSNVGKKRPRSHLWHCEWLFKKKRQSDRQWWVWR